MSLAGTALPRPTAESDQSIQTDVSILVIESFASTPLGPKIVYANDKASEETGYEINSLVGSPLGLIYDRSDLRNLIGKLPIIAGRAGFCWMDRTMIQNGGVREKKHWTIRPTHRENGKSQHFTLTFRSIEDVSNTKSAAQPQAAPSPLPSAPTSTVDTQREVSTPVVEAESELENSLQETRSESLAMAAGGVAHDFKNALQTIKSNLEMAQALAGSHSRLAGCLDDANYALDDAEVLARQMLAFTRGDNVARSIFNIAELVQRVSGLCTAGSQVNCQLTIEPNLRSVEGDPNRIYQVFHNLVINACQAMPNGGVLHLTAGNADLIQGNPYQVSAGSYTVVSVRDRGCGIPEDVLPRIFEKNFSTKSDGSGFGLASCRAIIDSHDGAIRAASRVGVGTEFLVFLPSSLSEPEKMPMEPAVTEAAPGNRLESSANDSNESMARKHRTPALVATPCRILIVDDQPGVLKATQGILQHLGHECITARNGEEAVSFYRQHLDSAEPIDVVLLDMTLPGGLNGMDVFKELKKSDPDVLVIATSGYFDDSSNDSVADAGFSDLLAKPFSMQDLSNSIAGVLA